MTYPQHEVSDKSQAIGEFLDWMFDVKGILRASLVNDRLYTDTTSVTSLLAEFYGIDIRKLEDEKLQMLEEFRSKNEVGR